MALDLSDCPELLGKRALKSVSKKDKDNLTDLSKGALQDDRGPSYASLAETVRAFPGLPEWRVGEIWELYGEHQTAEMVAHLERELEESTQFTTAKRKKRKSNREDNASSGPPASNAGNGASGPGDPARLGNFPKLCTEQEWELIDDEWEKVENPAQKTWAERLRGSS